MKQREVFWEIVAITKRHGGRIGEVAKGSRRAGSELKVIELRVKVETEAARDNLMGYD